MLVIKVIDSQHFRELGWV